MEFDPDRTATGTGGGELPDLASMLFKWGKDFGIGIKDLPGLIRGLGEAAREVKELNREMPVMDVIAGITALLDRKDDVSALVEVITSGILSKTDSGVRPTGDGEVDPGKAGSE